MVLHNTIIPPQQIFIQSNDAVSQTTTKSNLTFELKNRIKIPNNVDAYIQLNNFKFVNSFYNINTKNNNFYYSVDGLGLGLIEVHSIIIPIGNYTITTLITYLNTQLSGHITLQYNQSTFKITATNETELFILRTGANNILTNLGFKDEDTTASYTTTSDNLINLSGVQLLYIVLKNLNITSNSSGQLNNILEAIHINTLAGSTQSFSNQSSSKYKISDNNISSLEIEIYDENNNLVDFNNTNWFLTISFIFAYKFKYLEPKKLSDKTQQQVQQEQLIQEQQQPINNTDNIEEL